MKNFFMLSIMLILLMILVSCTEAQLESRFRERVLPNSLGDMTAVDKYRVTYFDEGAIIVYTGDDPQQAGYATMAYAVFQKEFGGWQSNQVGSTSRQNEALEGRLTDYQLTDFNFEGTGLEVTFEYRLLFGEILSPAIHSLEVKLDDGTMLQDDGVGGVFVFQTDTVHTFCELRVLDDKGKILDSIVPEYEADPSATPGPEC